MVGIGMLFIGLTLLSCVLWWRGTLFETRWLMWTYVFAVLLAFAANELGWVAAEVGRQPWIVYPTVGSDGTLSGGLRVADALSESVKAEVVLGSLIMFGFLYALLFALWVFLLNYKIQAGPAPHGPSESSGTEPKDLIEAASAHRGLAG
jgi:cytochrome d ubiquinol oxidase subunit I